MSIASEISRISQNIADSLEEVAAKGVTVPSGSNSDDLPELIAAIPTGSGTAVTVVDTLDANGGTIRTITAVSLAGDTVTAAHLESGYTAHDSLGNAIEGTLSPGVTPTGTINITTNGTHDVTNYATANVSVSGGTPNLQAKTDINPTTSSQTITADTGYDGLSSVQINAMPSGSATTPETTVTANPTISVNTTTGVITATASATKSVTPTVSAGYISSGTAGTITVSGSNTEALSTVSGTTIAPTESEQTAVAANKYTLGAVKVGAISSTYVGSGITSRSSTDLTASGATVTVPAGYYSTQATKSVSSMTLPTSASSSAISGYSSKATISRSTSDQYINIPTGYNSAGAYYKVSAVANGSATGPSSLSGSSATVSTGTNTITLTKTGVTTTPTVSAGYVSSATASTATVALTASVTTKAATTYHPSTSDQTIASGSYTTGAQTIKAVVVSGLAANKILSGTTVKIGDSTDDDCVTSVAGSVTFSTIYSGSSNPSSSTGVDGDIYIQTS